MHAAPNRSPLLLIIWQDPNTSPPPPHPEVFINPSQTAVRIQSQAGASSALLTSRYKDRKQIRSFPPGGPRQRSIERPMESAIVATKQAPLAAMPLPSSFKMGVHRRTHNDSPAVLWRPWLVTSDYAQSGCWRNKPTTPYSRVTALGGKEIDGKPQSFQHPVRLFWPKSKSYDYLYSDGEALLRNFPVQATISFYDESESEEEDEEECEEEESDEESFAKPQSCFSCWN
ncbi:hypothetical protein GJAV_G00135950 [Gymnothorax javanicus]|nr:hypothetical protein GJAV_G00135950 [Gymnothorax javanicus]